MPNVTYNRIDDSAALFMVNKIFTKLKASPLNVDRTYSLTRDSSTHHMTLTETYVNPSTQQTVTTVVGTFDEADGTNNGLLSAALFTKLSGIETGAQVNVLESISVNGTAVTLTNKNADITVPTAVSDLTNDAGYQNATEVNALITAAIADIARFSFVKVNSYQDLPAEGDPAKIYLVPHTPETHNIYDEYFWDVVTSDYELLGTTVTDLSGYVQASEMAVVSNSAIETLVNTAYTQVFGS